jgi:hypothetical protein
MTVEGSPTHAHRGDKEDFVTKVKIQSGGVRRLMALGIGYTSSTALARRSSKDHGRTLAQAVSQGTEDGGSDLSEGIRIAASHLERVGR